MSETIRIRIDEACRVQPQLLWDTVWVQEPITLLTAQGGFGDWDLSHGDEPGNVGGLRANATLHTATLLCLFTDRRAPDDAELDDSDDPRGWWGDSIKFVDDPFDAHEIGSHLWMLERGTLSEATELIAQEMCEVALHVLLEQEMVARTEVEVEAHPLEGHLLIAVRHFSHAGETAYDQKFQILWGQTVIFPEAQRLLPGNRPTL